MSGRPPTEGSRASLKHKGTGKESVAPSSWMTGSGRQYLDFKCSEKSKESF